MFRVRVRDSAATPNAADRGVPQRRSRRFVLVAAAGGVLATLADAVGRPSAARAMNGDPVLLGQNHSELHQTKISNNSAYTGDNANNRTLWLESANGSALVARSQHAGVDAAATDTSYGVGVYGHVGPIESFAAGPIRIGVYGRTSSELDGIGVRGSSSIGTGVQGSSGSGYAISAQGRLDFSTSGLTPIPAGASSKTISVGFDLTADSKIIATLESNQPGLLIQRVQKSVANDTFTVHLNTTVGTRRSFAQVAWLVIG